MTLAVTIVSINAAGDRTSLDVHFGTELWRQSCSWAESYGIDPLRVPAGFQLRYDRCVLDDNGKHVLRGREMLTEHVVEQLEGPPLPIGHPLTLPKDVTA